MSGDKDTCGSCSFYKPNELPENFKGQCRRRVPPFPLTEPDEWCGEFEVAPIEPHPYDDCCMCEEYCAPAFHMRRQAERRTEEETRIAKLSRWERWRERQWWWWPLSSTKHKENP